MTDRLTLKFGKITKNINWPISVNLLPAIRTRFELLATVFRGRVGILLAFVGDINFEVKS